MKTNLFFSCIFVLLTSVLHSQINKGSVLLGGNVGFSTNKAKDTSLENNSVSITPVAGIAVKQNLVVGFSLSYAHNKDNLNTVNYETKSESYGAGIFIRKYVPLGKGFYLFGETGLNYQDYASTYTYPSQKGELKVQNIGINLYPRGFICHVKQLPTRIWLTSIGFSGIFQNGTTGK